MADPLKIPIRASTQEHLEIEDIKENIIILKDGSCCLILATTAINFGLLSEREQEATIFAYAALLNSLTFSVQIFIRSKKKDVSSYLRLLDQELEKQENKLLRQQMEKYRRFVEEMVKKNNVLDKDFFIVIPFSIMELGAGRALGSLVKRKRGLPYSKNYILEQAKINLAPKQEQILKLTHRLSLRIHPLTSQEIIQLFYELYNPEAIETQRLIAGEEYTAPLTGHRGS